MRETAATAYVDGCNLLGPVVGNYSMNIALEKAKEAGIGWVVAKSKWLIQNMIIFGLKRNDHKLICLANSQNALGPQ